jgi:hypothetical protein
LIAIGQLLEAAIEPAEEAALFMMLALGNRLEQRGAQAGVSVRARNAENRIDVAIDSENCR